MRADRLLLLFAREPAAQAREKGLPPLARDLFTAMASGWRSVAEDSGARLAIAAPPEDLGAWRRNFSDPANVAWIPQRGASFGERLQAAAIDAGALSARVVVTGGDVLPSAAALASAFEALDSGADAVLSPAPDGGVSLIAVPHDTDLLQSIPLRRRNVFERLRRQLAARSRTTTIVGVLPDLDGRRGLRTVAQAPAFAALAALVDDACRSRRPSPGPAARPRAFAFRSPLSRGPPLAA